MTNTQRRFWTLLLTITFPIWIIPAVAIFWIVSFVVLLYAASAAPSTRRTRRAARTGSVFA